MKTTTLTLIALLTPLLAAQDSRPLSPKAAFARAKVLATQEQDPKAALQELDALLRRTDLDAELRTAVEQESARLRAAIAPIDAEAKRAEAEGRAKAAVAKLRNPDDAVGKAGGDDLVFLGDAAVPVLASAFPQHEQDRIWTIRASLTLTRIGSPAAAEAFRQLVRDGDDLRRRALLEGAAMEQQGLHSTVMREAFAVFFDLHDSALALLALRKLDRQLLPRQVLELLTTKEFGDGSGEVRAAAANTLVGKAERWAGEWSVHEGAFLAALADDLEHGDAFVLSVLARLRWASQHHEGRELALRALRAGQEMRWAGNWDQVSGPEPVADESVDLVLEVARAWKGRPIEDAVKHFAGHVVTRVAAGWTKANLAKLGEVAKLQETLLEGSSRNLQSRMVTIAKVEDLPILVHAAAGIRSNGVLLDWLAKKETAPEECIPELLVLLEQEAKNRGNHVEELCRMIASLGRATDLTELESLRTRYPAWISFGLVRGLRHVALTKPAPAVEAALLRYLVDPFEGATEVGRIRNAAFHALAMLGSKAALSEYPTAYRLGLEASQAIVGTTYVQARGLGWIVAMPKYSATELAKLGSELFRPDLEAAWEDLTSIAVNERVAPLVVAALRNLNTCPPQRRSIIAMQNVAAWLMSIPGREWVSCGLDATVLSSVIPLVLQRPVRATLMDRWASATPEVARNAAAEMLASPEVNARLTGLEFLGRVDAARAILELPKLARDADPAVRLEVASTVGNLGREDLAAVPLGLLRDPDAFVAKEARDALEKLRFVTEQTRFWSRLQRGTGLDAPSAAEALVLKAKKDQPKATRLLAIDSLGSLAVPETLPFLLELAAESDAEIAARATAAIAKINGAPRREK